MFTEREICLMISVPAMEDTATFTRKAVNALRNLLDNCQTVTPATREMWYVHPIKERMMPQFDYERPLTVCWQQEVEKLSEDCALVSGRAIYPPKPNKQTERTILTSARTDLCHIRKYRDPDKYLPYSELEIRMEIPYSLWNEMDQKKFIECVQRVCCTLGANYAAMEVAWLCPTSVVDGMFMYFSSSEEDREQIGWNKIPAVCWAQFLPLSRIAHYEEVLACDLPYCKSTPIHHNGQDYVWLQFTDNIWKPVYKNRLAFRKHFADSLPKLDYEKIAKFLRMPPYTYEIPWMPLLESEKEQLGISK